MRFSRQDEFKLSQIQATASIDSSTTKSLLELSTISCAYEGNQVVKSASFKLQEGEIGCLLGPSGCGKTTILRTIAGFHQPFEGNIHLNQQCIASSSTSLPPEQRKIGMVFQDYALFPHLNVLKNVMFGLDSKDKAAKARAMEVLELVKLEALADRFPYELSGGQQQRVALARALAPSPSLILLDEPFSNLDTELRRALSLEVRHILKKQNTSAILVTHDQEEAFSMADKIGVMQSGEIAQWDTPFELYHKPNTREIASFIGKGCLINAKVESNKGLTSELGQHVTDSALPHSINDHVDLLVRPEDIVTDRQSALFAKVISKNFLGASSYYDLQLESGTIIPTILSSHEDFMINDQVPIRFAADHLITFSKRHHK
jgi:iron(III) transport system ATP-binding protein